MDTSPDTLEACPTSEGALMLARNWRVRLHDDCTNHMNHAVKSAWEKAAQDLQIRLGDPNELSDVPSDPDRVIYVPDFGSPKGAIVFAQDFSGAPTKAFRTEILKSAHYFFSILSLAVYSKYSREDFVETLLDWGYFGNPADCPAWYSDAVQKLEASRNDGSRKP